MNVNKTKKEGNNRFASLLNSDSKPNNSRDNSRNYSRDNSRNHSRNYEERKSFHITPPKKEYNIMEEDFPEIIGSDSTKQENEQQPNLNYIEKCKLIKEEKLKEQLKPGWICIKRDTKTNNLLWSKNGIDFVKNCEDLKTKEEKDQEEKLYNQRAFNIYMELDNSRRQKSIEHYEIYGELDEYALAEINREKYEEYAKQFEIIESDEDSDEYVSD